MRVLPEARRRRRDDESGAIAIMAAVLIVATLLATSLAVDVGRTAFASRDQQGVTDRAALDAVKLVGAGGEDTLPGLYTAVAAAVDQTLARNPGTDGGTARDRTVERIALGRIEGAQQFVAVCDEDPGSAAPSCSATAASVDDVSAVRVDTSAFVPFVFAIGEDGRELHKQAVASAEAVGAISVGSRLVELDLNESPLFAPVMLALLEPLGVTSLPSLTAVGYDGLTTASVPLGDLLTLDATVLDRDSVVDSAEVNAQDFLQVVADGLHTDDPTAAAAANTFLLDLKEEIPADETVDLGELLHVTTEDPSAAASAEANVFDLVMGAVQVANEENAIDLQLSDGSLDPLNGLLGFDLLDFDLTLTVVEAPQIAVGPARFVEDQDLDGDGSPGDWVTWAQTAQVDLELTVDLKSNVAEDLLGSTLLNLIDDLLGSLTCGLLGLCPTETLTVTLSGAQAQADLTSVTCSSPDGGELGIDGDTRTASAQLNGRDMFADLGLEDEEAWSGLIDPVPGSLEIPPDGLLDVPLVEDVLTPVFGLLGVDLGAAEVRGLGADCSPRRLLPLGSVD